MKTTLCVLGFPLLGGLIAGTAPLKMDAKVPPASTANSITLLALNQPPCTVPSARAILRAKLAFVIDAKELSTNGFAVSIKFQGIDPRMTFSMGRQGVVEVFSRRDTLTLRYPMADIWNDARLRRPITCYLYLHRNMGNGRSSVIAQTKPIVFQECQ